MRFSHSNLGLALNIIPAARRMRTLAEGGGMSSLICERAPLVLAARSRWNPARARRSAHSHACGRKILAGVPGSLGDEAGRIGLGGLVREASRSSERALDVMRAMLFVDLP